MLRADRPRRLAVEGGQQIEVALLAPLALMAPLRKQGVFVIAPPREQETAVACSASYFGPGEYNLGAIRLHKGQTRYQPVGARMHGAVHAFEAQDVSIRGRGVLATRARPQPRPKIPTASSAIIVWNR